MNIERVFKALDEDSSNHALGIICAELESQGYRVAFDGIDVSSDELFSELPKALANKPVVNAQLSLDGHTTESLTIEFVDFHKIKVLDCADNLQGIGPA